MKSFDVTMIKVAENQLLAALDLTGNVGLNGLAGSAVPTTDFAAIEKLSPLEQLLVLIGVIPSPTFTSPLDGKWKESYEELFSPDSHQWSLGLRFEYPLGNNVGKADYRQAKMDGHRALWALRSLEQKIVLEVKEAFRALEVNRRKLRTSETRVRLAMQQLEAEHKRLSLGLSKNYQVLQMEQDLRNAQVNSLRAKVEYWKARAKMLKATGTFMTEEGISDDQISRIGFAACYLMPAKKVQGNAISFSIVLAAERAFRLPGWRTSYRFYMMIKTGVSSTQSLLSPIDASWTASFSGQFASSNKPWALLSISTRLLASSS